MKNSIRFPIAGFLLLALCGCASTVHRVHIDSIVADAAASRYSYRLVPAVEGIDESDLYFREYARYVDKALRAKGYGMAGEGEEPDILVFVGYGIGNPEVHERTTTEPVWGQTGFETVTTQEITENADGTKTQSEKTESVPSYGIVGYTTETETYTIYIKYIVLNAVDYAAYRDGKRTVQLWKTTITTRGVSDDLRKLFPIMIAASFDYIGTDTGEKIEIEIGEEDERIQALRN